MTTKPDQDQDPRFPEVRKLAAALEALSKDRRALNQAIAAIEEGGSQRAMRLLRSLERSSEKAEEQLRIGLTHLKLYFSILWLKAGRPDTPEKIDDVYELLELFGIRDLNSLGHMDDPRSHEIAGRLMAKVAGDLECERRLQSSTPVMKNLSKMADIADKKNLTARAAFLNAAAGIVAFGAEDLAMHHLVPLIRMFLEGRDRPSRIN